MGERSLKLYPLLCGLAAIWVMYKVLKELIPVAAMWFPLSLFGFSYIMIRYASELKQYMPDIFIALLLILFAFKVDIKKLSKLRFFLFWIVAGSVAIWASMPSVFLLAGVGAYYLLQSIREKQWRSVLMLWVIYTAWVAQFALYYFTILKGQAESQYLQSFHHYHFLFATPSKQEEWNHNRYVINGLLYQFQGIYPYANAFVTGFIIAGVLLLLRRSAGKMLLLVAPVVCLFLAASIDKYSLLPRVSLFIIPVLILLVSYGFAEAYYLKSRILRLIVILAGVYVAGCNINNTIEKRSFHYEELTEGLSYVEKQGLKPDNIYLYHSSIAAFTYYTEIHPDKEDWADQKDINQLAWHTNYDSLTWHLARREAAPVGFVFTNCTEGQFEEKNKEITTHLRKVNKLDKPYVKAYIYTKPEEEK